MRQRCADLNPEGANYATYAARGITVCGRWNDSFECFYADMGPRPSPEHSLDRIDNDGNYEPGNVRWATAQEQRSNRRTSFVYNGKRLNISEWAKEMKLPRCVLTYRLLAGWAVHKALTTPKGRYRNQ